MHALNLNNHVIFNFKRCIYRRETTKYLFDGNISNEPLEIRDEPEYINYKNYDQFVSNYN